MANHRAFFFHYNKPASRAAGKPVLTLHFAGKCHLVSSVFCFCPVSTHVRKKQPHCVVRGRGVVEIKQGRAVIS